MINKETNIKGDMQGVINTGSDCTINQTINVTSSPSEKESQLCETSYSKPKDIYIERKIDKKIEKKLNQNKSSILFINGRGGIGKSTLLKEIQNKVNTPSIRINISDDTDIDMGKVLLDKSQTTTINCPNFEQKRNQFIQKNIMSDYELVEELRKDFTESGLFIVDTFEKYMNVNIQTKIHFADNKFERNLPKSTLFRDYLESLIYHFIFDTKTIFIIGGRTKLKDIKRGKDNEYLSDAKKFIVEFSFEVFTLENIQDYFDEFTKINDFEMPSYGQLNSIEEVTKGNPLLIHSFAHVAKTYSSWEDADFKEMKQKVEEDSKYGLLYYFTEKIASCTTLGNELWKLVVPRVLNEEIVKILFQKSSILNTLIDAGLAFKKNNKYFLHDEVFIAITAHAKKEFKKNFLSWHDHKEVRAIHQKLAQFYEYKRCDNNEVNFESCYHRMMMKQDFDFSLNGYSSMTKEDFIHYFLGSLFIGYDEKIQICKEFESLEKEVIEEKVRKVMAEVEEILPQMSSGLYAKCLTDIGQGTLKNGIYDIEYLNKLLDREEYKEELALYKFLGQAYQSKKSYTKERAIYNNAISLNLDKEDEYFYLLIGNTYYRENNYNKALTYYELSIRVKPRGETYNNIGAIYQRQKKEDLAIKFYKESLEIKPSEFTYIDLSNIYYDKKNYNQAIYLLNKAININPLNSFSHQCIANCYREKKEYTKALISYKKSLDINPKNEFTYNAIGILFENKKQYKEAITYYKKAISINSSNEWFYSNLAGVYFEIGDYTKTKKFYLKAIKINPNNATHYNNLAIVVINQEHQPWYLKLVKTKQFNSISLYNKAIELDPKNIQFYMSLANAYILKKNYDKAIEIYQKVISLNPNHTNAFFKIANIYLEKKKNYKIALKLYKELLIKNTKLHFVNLKLGDCYFQLKDYDNAIKSYHFFIRQTKNNYNLDVYNKLMKCHFYQKEFKMMIEVFKAKRSKIIFMRRLHQDRFKKKIKLWFENILSNREYLLIGIGILVIGVISTFGYLIFLIMV